MEKSGTPVFVSPGPETPRFGPVHPRPCDSFSQQSLSSLLIISLRTRVRSFTPRLAETSWQNQKKRNGFLNSFHKPDPRSEPQHRTLCSTLTWRVGDGNFAHGLMTTIDCDLREEFLGEGIFGQGMACSCPRPLCPRPSPPL